MVNLEGIKIKKYDSIFDESETLIYEGFDFDVFGETKVELENNFTMKCTGITYNLLADRVWINFRRKSGWAMAKEESNNIIFRQRLKDLINQYAECEE